MNGSCEIVTGSMGSSKSSYAVEEAVELLSRGGWVYSNIEIHVDKVAHRLAESGLVFEPERLVFLDCPMNQVHKHVRRGTADCPVLLAWDEAHIEGNALDHKTADRDLLTFVTFARKLDIRLLFLTQHPDNVLKQVRRLIQRMIVCRNMKQLKIFGFIPTPLPLYFRVFYDCTAQNRPPSYQYFETFLNSPVWGLFKSDAILGPEKAKYEAMKTAVREPLKRCKPVKKAKRPGLNFNAELLAMAACAGVIAWLG